MINPFETQLERIPTKDEVLEVVLRCTKGAEVVPEFTREKYDERGLYLHEVRVNGDKEGDYVEYLYLRKGEYPDGNATTATGVSIIYYEDGIPVGGKNLEEYNEQTDEWTKIQE
jgi:hypothetical protein